MFSPTKIKASLCCKVQVSLAFSPSPVNFPCLHFALSQGIHWSAKTTDFVRGDSSQTEHQQPAAIRETTDSCKPPWPHRCLLCPRIKGSGFCFFPPLLASREIIEFTVCLTALVMKTQQHRTITRVRLSCFPILFSVSKATPRGRIYKEEKARIIKVEDLQACAWAHNMLL